MQNKHKVMLDLFQLQNEFKFDLFRTQSSISVQIDTCPLLNTFPSAATVPKSSKLQPAWRLHGT